MPGSDCDSPALQEALTRYRRANARRRNSQAELEQLVKELRQQDDTRDLEATKKLTEILELLAQAGGAVEDKSLFGGLETIEKALGLITQAMIDKIRERHARENAAERLRILSETLRLDVEEEHEARDKAGVLLDAYYACTEKFIPKRVRFQLDAQIEGGFLGIVARSEVCISGEASLHGVKTCSGTEERLYRWLDDPTLAEQYDAKGELSLTIPVYLWTSARSDVKALNVTHHEDGGALSFDLSVRWYRGKPDQLDVLWVLLVGSRVQHVRGEVSVFGHSQSFSSDHDLMQSVRQALTSHAEPLQRHLYAGCEPGATWHHSDTKTQSFGRSALDVAISR